VRARVIFVRRRGHDCHELERWNSLCRLESRLPVRNCRLCRLQARFQDRVGLHHSLADPGFLRALHLAEASWGADLVELDFLRVLHLAEASWGAEWVDLGLLPDVALLPMTYPRGVAQGEAVRCDQ
jgi:hypothetical protein